MATKVQYFVNGVASNWWNRITSSKTTYIVTAFVLAKVEPLFENDGWQHMANWKSAAALAFGGAGLILVRSAIKKAELAANAVNPAITGVKAVEVHKSPGLPGGSLTALLLFCFAMVGMLSLSACTAGSKLGEVITNPDGKPVVTGTICVNTPNGRICYMPQEETIVKPNPTPAPSAPAIAQVPEVVTAPVTPLVPAAPAVAVPVATPPPPILPAVPLKVRSTLEK